MRATKRQPSAVTPSTRRRNRPPTRRATNSPATVRASRKAAVAPRVAPIKLHTVTPDRPKQGTAGETENGTGKEKHRGGRVDQDKANRCPDTERTQRRFDRFQPVQVSVRQHPTDTRGQQKDESEARKREAADH